MNRLLYPLLYFGIKNRAKLLLDLIPPIVLAGAGTLLLTLIEGVNFFGYGGVLANVMGLTAALTGFFVAALTAAATFQNPDLDHKIENGALVLRGRKLSRREWVCHMFGYLAFSAMAFTIVAAISVPSAVALGGRFGGWTSVGAKFLCLWWLAHIFVVTNIGLYYLVERLGDKTPSITTSKSEIGQ